MEVPYALLLAALTLYLIANLFPLLTLDIHGHIQTTTLTGASLALYRADMALLAGAVWFSSVVAPGLVIAGGLYVLSALRYSLRLPGLVPVMVWISRVHPWGMLDVFLLGVLVALVKLVGLASVIPGPGLYGFVALIVVMAAATGRMEVWLLWDRLGAVR